MPELVDNDRGNAALTHTQTSGCPTPVGAWGQLGTNVGGPTSTDGRFSTIHTPYCSLFLLDLNKEKEGLR